MKFIAQIKPLQETLSKVIAVIPAKSTLPQLETVSAELKGNRLSFTGTDLEITVVASLEVSGVKDGTANIPAKLLYEIIRALPEGELTFTLDKTTRRAQLETAQGNYQLSVDETAQLPNALAEFKPEGSITIDAATIRRLISKTLFAVSTDELRPVARGAGQGVCGGRAEQAADVSLGDDHQEGGDDDRAYRDDRTDAPAQRDGSTGHDPDSDAADCSDHRTPAKRRQLADEGHEDDEHGHTFLQGSDAGRLQSSQDAEPKEGPQHDRMREGAHGSRDPEAQRDIRYSADAQPIFVEWVPAGDRREHAHERSEDPRASEAEKHGAAPAR